MELRNRQSYESKQDVNKRLETHYKRVESNLKRRKNQIYLAMKGSIRDMADLVYRLIIQQEATYIGDIKLLSKLHCNTGAFRSAQDLYYLHQVYIGPISYKECSELLQKMVEDKFLTFHYCNTVRREVYNTRKLTTKLSEIREYLKKKK